MNYKNKNDILTGSKKQTEFHLFTDKWNWNINKKKLNNIKGIKAFTIKEESHE